MPDTPPADLPELEGALFPDLPEQLPSPFRETDEHFLEPCSRCGGTGTEASPFPRGSYRHLMWDPTCRKCNGAGKRLIYIGRAVDA
jgi:hypothetical protein